LNLYLTSELLVLSRSALIDRSHDSLNALHSSLNVD